MEVPIEKMYKKTSIKSQSSIVVDEDCDVFLQMQQSAVKHTGMMENCPNDNLNQKDQKLTVDITIEEVKEVNNTSNQAGARRNYKFNSKHKRFKRKRTWEVLDSISKDVTDYADQQLAVEVANTLGRLDSPKEKKLQQALLKWQDWLRTNEFAHIGSPVFYKCYTCSKGWWRLYPFREHIETHKEVLKIKLETTYFESSIVAYVGNKPLKRIVHIEGNCLKCSKGLKEHKFYRCYVCQFAFGNCTALYRHDCRKMQSRRGVILESVKLEICSICGYKCRSLEMYNHMSLIHTVPSDEPVNFSTELHSDCGMKYVSNDLHASPMKVRKFHDSTLSRLLKDIADSDIMCQSAVQNTGMMENLPVDNLKQKDQKFTADITVEEVKEVKNRSNQADAEKNQYQSKQKIINRKRMWQVLESISKDVTGYADRQLAVEVANTWGRLDTMILQDSAKEKKLQQALLKWQDWLRTNEFAHIGSPVFYKCYTCSKGWWRLYPFREHIETHKEVLKIKLETTYFESSIVAYVGNKPLKKVVHIEGNCLKCSKGMKEHKFYRCYVCQFAFGNCTALYRHDCRKMQSRRGVILESVKLEICSICGYKCRSLEMYNHMSLIHTVPSDEPVDFSPELHSDCGMKYVCHDLHACPIKAREIYCYYCPRKFDNSTLSRLHMDIADSNVKCQICSELLPRQCMLMEHLSAHSEHFAMVPKCSLCTVPVVFSDDVSAKYHMKACHDKIETRNRTYHDMVIIPKIVVKKWRNIDSMDPNTIYKEEDALSDDETNEVVQSDHFNDTLQNNKEAGTDVETHDGENVNNGILKNELGQETGDEEINENVQSNRVNVILKNNTETNEKKSVNNGMLKNELDQETGDEEINENVQSNRVNVILKNNTETNEKKSVNNGMLKNELDQETGDEEINENVQSNRVNVILKNNTETNEKKSVNNGMLKNELDQETGDEEINENVQSNRVNVILKNNTETNEKKSVNNGMLKNELDQETGDEEINENVQSNRVNVTLQNNTETNEKKSVNNGMLKNDLDKEICEDVTNENVQNNHFNGILQNNTEAHTAVDSCKRKTINIDILKNYLDQKINYDEINENFQSNHFNGILQDNKEAHYVDTYNGKTINIDILKNDLNREMNDDETNENVQSNLHVNNILQNNTETYIDIHDGENVINGMLINDLDTEMCDDETNENVESNHVNGILNDNKETDIYVETFNEKSFSDDDMLKNDLDTQMCDDETNENVESNHVNGILNDNKETDIYVETFNEKSFSDDDKLKNDLDTQMCDDETNENVQSNRVNGILNDNKDTDIYVETFNEESFNDDMLKNDLDTQMCDDETNENVQSNHVNDTFQNNTEAHSVGLA